MLVGTSYPLYAPNRLWSYPYGAGTDVFFSQDGVQSFYNATTCLLTEIFPDDKELQRDALRANSASRPKSTRAQGRTLRGRRSGSALSATAACTRSMSKCHPLHKLEDDARSLA